jgi:hypothetical protein
MKRYHVLCHGVMLLQARWRGLNARRCFRLLCRHYNAMTIYRVIRGYVYRKRYLHVRHAIIRIQSFLRMCAIRKRCLSRMEMERHVQTFYGQIHQVRQRLFVAVEGQQLQDLEREKNDEENDDHDGGDDSGDQEENDNTWHVQQQDTYIQRSRVATDKNTRMIMADAGGMIDYIQDENAHLRLQLNDVQAQVRLLRDELERMKQEKDMLVMVHQVKARQDRELVRERDKTIVQLEKELERVKATTAAVALSSVPYHLHHHYRHQSSPVSAASLASSIASPTCVVEKEDTSLPPPHPQLKRWSSFRKLGAKKETLSSPKQRTTSSNVKAALRHIIDDRAQKEAMTSTFLETAAQELRSRASLLDTNQVLPSAATREAAHSIYHGLDHDHENMLRYINNHTMIIARRSIRDMWVVSIYVYIYIYMHVCRAKVFFLSI